MHYLECRGSHGPLTLRGLEGRKGCLDTLRVRKEGLLFATVVARSALTRRARKTHKTTLFPLDGHRPISQPRPWTLQGSFLLAFLLPTTLEDAERLKIQRDGRTGVSVLCSKLCQERLRCRKKNMGRVIAMAISWKT